jgi:molybdate transport system substrate-binding protein
MRKGYIAMKQASGRSRVARLGLIAASVASGTACEVAEFPSALGEVRVLMSAGFAAPYADLVTEFERTEGVTVLTSRAASTGDGPNTVAGRLARGDSVDVVILASASMDELVSSGSVIGSSRVDLARTGIGMAVRQGASQPDIGSVEALRRTLLAATSVAYSSSVSGVYISTELFPRLGIVAEMAPKSVVTNAVGAAVAGGEVEIGFQQVSELLPVEGIDLVGPLPPEVQLTTAYSAAVVADAESSELGEALISFLSSSAARGAIQRWGLEPLAGP